MVSSDVSSEIEQKQDEKMPKDWTVEDVCNWIKEMCPSFNPQPFIDEHINGKALLLLDSNDIMELKLPLGVRKTVTKELEVRNKKRIRTGNNRTKNNQNFSKFLRFYNKNLRFRTVLVHIW